MNKTLGNKGFSVLECVFCLLLISFSAAGLFNILFFVNNANIKKEYETTLFNNLKLILDVGEINSSKHLDLLKEIYQDNLKETNDDKVLIEVKLENKYKGCESIIYEVSCYEEDDYKVTFVNIVNVIEEYEEINNEKFTKRIYQK